MDRFGKGSVFQVDIAETNGTGINVSVLTLIYVKWGEGKGPQLRPGSAYVSQRGQSSNFHEQNQRTLSAAKKLRRSNIDSKSTVKRVR